MGVRQPIGIFRVSCSPDPEPALPVGVGREHQMERLVGNQRLDADLAVHRPEANSEVRFAPSIPLLDRNPVGCGIGGRSRSGPSFGNCPAFVRLLRSTSLCKPATSNASERSQLRPLAPHPGEDACHLPEGICFAYVVTAPELVDRAIELLGTQLVTYAGAAALEH